MKSAAILAALVLTLPVLAQEEPPPPDYSRQKLLRFVAEIPEPPKHERNLRFQFGSVEFRALGMNWRIIYLPIMVPLSGSGLRTTSTLPDPFALTGTEIATPPRAWRTQRQINAETRRIEKTERARVRVKSD